LFDLWFFAVTLVCDEDPWSKVMTDRHASRLIVGVWVLTVGVAMAAWLAGLGWIALLLVERVAT
jgi:hypothetical protein